jgi:hypothetical protein
MKTGKTGLPMLRNIIVSADDDLIRNAQENATREQTTLNELFNVWLWEYVNAESRASQFDALMQSIEYVQPGRSFSRDEMNER